MWRLCAGLPNQRLAIGEERISNHLCIEVQRAAVCWCDACVHVSAPAAIIVDHAPSASWLRGEVTTTLRSGELVKCERCGARIAWKSGIRLCAVCEYRRKNPFGSMVPPGLATNPNVLKKKGG